MEKQTTYELARKQETALIDLTKQMLALVAEVHIFDDTPESNKYDCDDPRGFHAPTMGLIYSTNLTLSRVMRLQSELTTAILKDLSVKHELAAAAAKAAL